MAAAYPLHRLRDVKQALERDSTAADTLLQLLCDPRPRAFLLALWSRHTLLHDPSEAKPHQKFGSFRCAVCNGQVFATHIHRHECKAGATWSVEEMRSSGMVENDSCRACTSFLGSSSQHVCGKRWARYVTYDFTAVHALVDKSTLSTSTWQRRVDEAKLRTFLGPVVFVVPEVRRSADAAPLPR